jgi:Flagellin and related hook-associated proteins
MSDITLSAGVRQNLSTLQSTADMLGKVQNRLATGNKVNSALDNPSSYFTASSLNARAGDLSSLQDDMGQAVQVLKAADQGITSITKLVQSAKAKANQAASTSSQYERKQYASQYNEILTQIGDVARDSGYNGKNLLGGTGNDLSIKFNENGSSKLDVTAVDYTDVEGGLGLGAIDEGKAGTTSFTLKGATDTIDLGGLTSSDTLASAPSGFAVGDVLTFGDGTSASPVVTLTITATTTVKSLVDTIDGIAGVNASFDETSGELSIVSNDTFVVANDGSGDSANAATLASAAAADFSASTATLVGSAGFQKGDKLTFTDGNGYEVGSLEIDDETTVDDLVKSLNDIDGVTAAFDDATGKMTITSDVDLAVNSTNSDFNVSDFTAIADGTDAVSLDATDSGFALEGNIDDVVKDVTSALTSLRTQASSFGSSLSTVEIRQDFTKNMINTLKEGAGKLTLADTNEEGANLLALNTRQSLASTSLSFASQADQQVLRLL